MEKKVLKIKTSLPGIPSWLKINNTVTFPLPLKTAKDLAAKLLELQDDVEIEFSFSTGKERRVEFKFEGKKQSEDDNNLEV